MNLDEAMVKALEKRMARIEGKAAADRKAEEDKLTEKEKRTADALAKIKALTPRIQALIALGNKCIEQGIAFPSSSETPKFGYGKGCYNFLANSCHRVGFMDTAMRQKTSNIKYLGIYEGGVFGEWHFYTNGEETFLRHEDNKDLKKEAEFSFSENFLEQFDTFESAFYKWIDSMAPAPEKEPEPQEPMYRPRFTDCASECILCDSVWDWEKALDYADSHNLDVLYTETGSSELSKVLMAFNRRGFILELKERPVTAPGGLVLEPKLEVLFTNPRNKRMDRKTYLIRNLITVIRGSGHYRNDRFFAKLLEENTGITDSELLSLGIFSPEELLG